MLPIWQLMQKYVSLLLALSIALHIQNSIENPLWLSPAMLQGLVVFFLLAAAIIFSIWLSLCVQSPGSMDDDDNITQAVQSAKHQKQDQCIFFIPLNPFHHIPFPYSYVVVACISSFIYIFFYHILLKCFLYIQHRNPNYNV